MNEKTERKIKIITISAVVLFFVLIISLLVNIISVAVLRSKRNNLQSQYNAMTSQNREMQNEIDYKSSDAYLEQYAREILGMIKDGEKVIIIK